ncbi:MAG: cyclodeaminase/cyclohydrolase family protein [Planctomycetota bacterium]
MIDETDFSKLTLDNFLDRVSSRTPTPGGGSVTAAVGALAGALSRMVVAYTKIPEEGVALPTLQCLPQWLQRTDELFRALITKDAQVYSELCAVQKNATSPSTHALCVAQQNAASVALEVAALASNALASLDEVKGALNPRLASDVGIAAVLFEAVAKAAAYTVFVNIQCISDESLRNRIKIEVREVVGHARDHSESIQDTIRPLLQTDVDLGR